MKRLFFGFTLFVALFTSVAWQFAAEELLELKKEIQPQLADKEFVDQSPRQAADL